MQSRFPSHTPRLFPIALALGSLLLAGWLTAQQAPSPPEDWQLAGDAERGRSTYDQFCATCHGPKGRGDGVMSKFLDPKPKDLANREYMDTRSDYQIYLAIKKGGAEVGLSDKMAPWETLISEQEIRDLTLLVRTLSREP